MFEKDLGESLVEMKAVEQRNDRALKELVVIG